jgi:ABC-2 type transport system ATP-binding protein
VKQFSGGMRRRLEIARGLLHHPKILFLDEPTIGLDPQTRNHLWSYVTDLNAKEGITVFLTTHYMEEADKVASRIAVIDHGKIIAIGSSDELKAKTNTTTLEDAFLSLTGSAIREEQAGAVDQLRHMARMWGRRK